MRLPARVWGDVHWNRDADCFFRLPETAPLSVTSLPASNPFAGSARRWMALWTPCVAMMLLSLISLVDRSILGILSPSILRELHLTAAQYGVALLVFSICYMGSNPIWGHWMDRLGLFWAAGVAVAIWSLASGAHALLAGFLSLCMARGVLGFGEGATFPAGLKTVTETLPMERRSFGLGLAYSGGSLGALLTPLVVTPLALRFGWRSSFVLSAVVGFAWIAVWIVLRRAGLYRAVAPVAGLAGNGAGSGAGSGAGKWNRDLFATAAAYGLGAAPLAFGLNMGPLYLARVLHLPQAELGHLLWLPPAGWEAGYLFWGWLADRRRARAEAAGAGTPSPLGLFTLFAVGTASVCLIPPCARLALAVPLTMGLLVVTMFLSGGFVVISLAHGATTQAKENTGFLAGFSISGWSLATGLLMPVVGAMFDRNLYAESFWVVAALPFAGVGVWWWLSSAGRGRAARV